MEAILLIIGVVLVIVFWRAVWPVVLTIGLALASLVAVVTTFSILAAITWGIVMAITKETESATAAAIGVAMLGIFYAALNSTLQDTKHDS